METEHAFDLSDKVIAGLVSSQIVRRGGVLHQVSSAFNGAGRIAYWIREMSSTPLEFASMGLKQKQMNDLLGLVGSVPSVLGLGATIGFGAIALRKLVSVERRLREIEGKLDGIRWTIELGFANTLRGLDQISVAQEFEVVSNVKSSARLAWEAQSLEPESNQRTMRLENALMLGTQAAEQLILRTQHEMEAAITWLKEQPTSRSRSEITDSTVSAIQRFRQTCLAVSNRASIQAETASPVGAACGVEQDINVLRPLLSRIAYALLRGSEPEDKSGAPIYQDLLKVGAFPSHRIVSWAQRFDPNVDGVSGILDVLRKDGDSPSDHGSADLIRRGIVKGGLLASNALFRRDKSAAQREFQHNNRARENLLEFGNCLDGAWEDVDRLSGYEAEYRMAGEAGFSIQKYRDVMAMPEIETDQPIVFFKRKA